MKPILDPEAIEKSKIQTKKPEVLNSQKLDVRYIVEDPETENRPQRFLAIFAAILKNTNYGALLDQYSRLCAKCSRCATECFLYRATGNPEDIPAARTGLLLDVYRQHFTLGGKLTTLFGKESLTDETIAKMAEGVWNCTACRKCLLECPVGIDHGLVTHLIRYILSEMGIMPRALHISVKAQLEGEHHNTSNIPLAALSDTIEFLEEELEEDKGIPIKMPMDQEGAEYIFFAPVSDYLMEADTLMGIAAVMHATGASWTIGTKNADAINYGLFYNDILLEKILKALVDEFNRLQGKTVLIGECGHASRSTKAFLPTFCGGKDAPPMMNILEYTYDAWKKGKFKLDPDVITEKVTYHDPCNIARSGWITERPRELIKAFCKDYVEMTPNREANICCGGGGGTVSIDEVRPYRTGVSGQSKAEQIRATGAKIVIAPCANCKKQLRELVEDNKLDCEVVGLHDLIYKAIIMEKPEQPAQDTQESQDTQGQQETQEGS